MRLDHLRGTLVRYTRHCAICCAWIYAHSYTPCARHMRMLSLCAVLRFGVALHTAHALLSCAEDHTCAIYALTAYTALISLCVSVSAPPYIAPHTALRWFVRIHRTYDPAAPHTAHGLIERHQAHTAIKRNHPSASDFHAPRSRRYSAHGILLRCYALHFALRGHANSVFSASLTANAVPSESDAPAIPSAPRQRFVLLSATGHAPMRHSAPPSPAYVCDLGAGVTQYPAHRMISAPLSALLGPVLFVISEFCVVCLCVRKHLIVRNAL